MSDNAKRRPPVHPGAILREDLFLPLGLTQKQLAFELGYDTQQLRRLMQERARVTRRMAKALSARFQNSTEFWMNLQAAVDAYMAEYPDHVWETSAE